jgi:hypothetical protein
MERAVNDKINQQHPELEKACRAAHETLVSHLGGHDNVLPGDYAKALSVLIISFLRALRAAGAPEQGMIGMANGLSLSVMEGMDCDPAELTEFIKGMTGDSDRAEH